MSKTNTKKCIYNKLNKLVNDLTNDTGLSMETIEKKEGELKRLLWKHYPDLTSFDTTNFVLQEALYHINSDSYKTLKKIMKKEKEKCYGKKYISLVNKSDGIIIFKEEFKESHRYDIARDVKDVLNSIDSLLDRFNNYYLKSEDYTKQGFLHINSFIRYLKKFKGRTEEEINNIKKNKIIKT